MIKRKSAKKIESKAAIPCVAANASSQSRFSVAGIGASAGGLDALLQLFSSLPTKTNLAFIVVQHLEPTHRSQLPEILSRSTALPVREIKDGTHVEPNYVYVIPPNFNLTLSNGVLNLLPRPQGLQRAIDFFFESLAKSKKMEAIGIILSGTGVDGTAGLTSIKAEGGITFAQDPGSAKHGAMPRSAIETGVADFILNPKDIAKELVRMSKSVGDEEFASTSEFETHTEESKELSEEAIQRIFSLIRDHTLIDFSNYKISTIRRRIQRQMRVHRQDSLAAYAKYLESHPQAVTSLYEDMFIHVTEFFRDADSFLSLKASVFPRLLKNKAPGVPIRIWVPGCSTGEEAYSLVMSLLEFLGTQASKTLIQVFATDISEQAIQNARAGIYSEHQVQGVSQDRLKKFFDVAKDGYKVKKAIRELCVFSRHDVANNPPFAKIDLISCRNVLIYFAPTLQKKVMPIFHYALNPDGFLWLGKSEAPSGFSKLFTLADKTNKIYSKLNVPSPMNFRFPIGRHLSEHTDSAKKDSNHFTVAIDSLKEFDRVATSRYAPAGIIINSNMEIIQVRGRTGSFLEFPTGQPNYHLLKALRPELLASVRTTIQSAMKQNATTRKEGLTYQQGSQRKKVNLEVIPANPTAPQKERQFFIFFEDDPGTKQKISVKKVASGKKNQGKKKADTRETYIVQLLEELDATREYQQSLAEGYEVAQEELTSANEELQSTNEELQSTNEEMETAKEELQAANEELSTINDELQNRNEELNTLNEKLVRSEERFRLMVEGVKDYAIFMLDPDGKVATWNEGARRLKGYEPSEIIGKHFSVFYGDEDRNHEKPTWELKEAAKGGRIEDEGWRVRKDGSRFWASVVITRINDENGNLLGFSKVTRDLTERKRNEDALREANDSLEIRVKERIADLQATQEKLTEALRFRDEFLSIASHELKTPLTSLKLQLQLALRKREDLDAGQITRAFNMCLKQANSLTELVDDLLDVSKFQTGKFTLACEDMDLSELTRDVLGRFTEQLSSVNISLELKLLEPLVGYWDRQRLEQVLTNLVSNAIKYAPRGPLRITTARTDNKAIFTIQDSGPGIEKEKQTKIFERFERAGQSRNVGGLGLGLYIVRRIVEIHHGSISVESEPGHGSKFRVELPVNSCPEDKEDSS